MFTCPHTNDIRARLMRSYLALVIDPIYRQPELLSIFHLGGLQKSALGALVVKYTGMVCMEIHAVSMPGCTCSPVPILLEYTEM